MNRSDFYYRLPRELIAQRPAAPRDSSRLMCLNRASGEISTDMLFRGIADLLAPGDLLVVNDSKVIPARLLGLKEGTGASAELLLLRDLGADRWECLARPGKRLKPGARLIFGGGELRCHIEAETSGGRRIARFEYSGSSGFYPLLSRVGSMPLPPYITAPLESDGEYQTVYARVEGSAAAPTAGFHFTRELLDILAGRGVGIARVTLHVGLGTFRPVKEDDITRHLMHSERYSIPPETAADIAAAKSRGGRIIPVGTTACRTLEAAALRHGGIVPCDGETDIFIYPGYEFRASDALITNFHLPESTLIMLVSAFAGHENTMRAYGRAVEERFRFFSFGDAMFIF